MSDIIIQIENLSKQYRLGEVSTGTLVHDFNRGLHRLLGRPDPYLQVTGANERHRRAADPSADYVWALRDIQFEVKRGEVLGIIGRNGAGKSTLLKILSRITAPTTGEIRIDGRIAALLEVGTGFHPDLTGRENIFLNGAILGMSRAEIQGKLDEIVDFSGCARYLDTPVKRYSSGMIVRLGFAVAAHLEPDILIVDEVLAVGDAEFQKKCIGKMQDVAGHGRTVLFVSHNMASILELCPSAMLLNEGRNSPKDETEKVVQAYLEEFIRSGREILGGRHPSADQPALIFNVALENGQRQRGLSIPSGCEARFVVETEAIQPLAGAALHLGLYDMFGKHLAALDSQLAGKDLTLPAGRGRFEFRIPALPFVPGTYYANIALVWRGTILDRHERCVVFCTHKAGDDLRVRLPATGAVVLDYQVCASGT